MNEKRTSKRSRFTDVPYDPDDLEATRAFWKKAIAHTGLGELRAKRGRPAKAPEERKEQIALRVDKDVLVGTLDYGDIRVATGTMGYKHRSFDPAKALAAVTGANYLLKIIPHVDCTPRVCELVRYRCQDVVIKGAWEGPAALQLFEHALAPVARLPVLEVVGAVHILTDLTLGLGEVVHDYLSERSAGARRQAAMATG